MDSPCLGRSFLTTIICLPEHITYRILSFCDLEQLLAMSGASWMTRTLVKLYTRHAWSFDLRFKLWFYDVRGFQMMLRRYHAIVSGSLALQFFDRVHSPQTEMDLYVHHSRVRYVAGWFATEGYTMTSGCARSDVKKCLRSRTVGPYQKGLHGTSITIVINYDKYEVLWDGTQRRRRIRIVGVEVHPIHHIIHEFHSTGVMNFISGTVAVSLFPKSTFIHRKFAMLRGTVKQSREWMEKYRARGFSIIKEGEGLKPFDGVVGGDRNVLDSFSWKVGFEVSKLFPGPGYTKDRTLEASFRLVEVCKASVDGQGGSILRMSRPVLSSGIDTTRFNSEHSQSYEDTLI